MFFRTKDSPATGWLQKNQIHAGKHGGLVEYVRGDRKASGSTAVKDATAAHAELPCFRPPWGVDRRQREHGDFACRFRWTRGELARG